MFSGKIRGYSAAVIMLFIFFLLSGLSLAGCNMPTKQDSKELYLTEPPGYPGASGEYMSLSSETSSAPLAVEQAASGSGGNHKPVGFVNYGEFDATVRAESFIPLGQTEYAAAPAASTVSAANHGSGSWPNPGRFLKVPMGAYSWCVEWEEGDLDQDGQIDYFHYIQNDPTVLDENDSAELDFAEEVAIAAPPEAAAILVGKCVIEDPTLEYVWVQVGIGDYVGSDVDSSEGPVPDDSKAAPGIIAICWDNVEEIHFSGRAWCTYKNVAWEECFDGPYKGRLYTAEEKE